MESITQPDIQNCKPGIWASTYRHASNVLHSDTESCDAIVCWVEEGRISLEEFDPKKQRPNYVPAASDWDHDFTRFRWTSYGVISVDGGLANILASNYLNIAADHDR